MCCRDTYYDLIRKHVNRITARSSLVIKRLLTISKRGLLILLVKTAHLHADPVQLSEHPRIYMLCEFLSDEECDHVIAMARPHLIASKVVDEQNKGEAVDARRTSRGFFIHNNWADPIIIDIEKRIAATTGLPMQNGEDLHVLHY